MTKEELKEKRRKIYDVIDKLYDEICDVRLCEEQYIKIEELYDEIRKINEELMFLEPVVASNEYVDLRVYDELTFVIFIHGSRENVGSIEYRDYHVDPTIGDIGYTIYEKYRGNHYAYHALCALAEYLKNNNVPDFWISTNKHNLPSYKTIKKYGGAVIKEDEDYIMYECSTYKKK